MARNLGFSTLLSVAVIAVIMLFAAPIIGANVKEAQQFITAQEPGSYTGEGIITAAEQQGTGCSVELIANSELVSATAPTCAGLQLGDTVRVTNNLIQ